MTLKDICDVCGAKLLCGDLNREFDGVYVGDLLSRAMSHVEADNVWITIMANINTVAVATLADPAAVILAEDVELPEDVLAAAKEKDVTFITSSLSAYELCAIISRESERDK